MTSIALTIAGSDSGGGAGIQADLKTFSALGVYGATVITAVTAQNTRGVDAVHSVPTDVVRAQIETVLSDLDVKAIKIGMLGMPDLIECVVETLSDFNGPIVVDPVMISKSGANLLPLEAVDALRTDLVPRSDILTPNIPEAAVLLEESEAESGQNMKQQGRKLLAMGTGAVLMKAGHREGQDCSDLFISREVEISLTARRVMTKNTHGTGCSYSSAIAAGLAKGQELETAVRQAHRWLQQAIRHADRLLIGHGHGPVHHFYDVWL